MCSCILNLYSRLEHSLALLQKKKKKNPVSIFVLYGFFFLSDGPRGQWSRQVTHSQVVMTCHFQTQPFLPLSASVFMSLGTKALMNCRISSQRLYAAALSKGVCMKGTAHSFRCAKSRNEIVGRLSSLMAAPSDMSTWLLPTAGRRAHLIAI
jgi:hypothetical protein